MQQNNIISGGLGNLGTRFSKLYRSKTKCAIFLLLNYEKTNAFCGDLIIGFISFKKKLRQKLHFVSPVYIEPWKNHRILRWFDYWFYFCEAQSRCWTFWTLQLNHRVQNGRTYHMFTNAFGRCWIPLLNLFWFFEEINLFPGAAKMQQTNICSDSLGNLGTRFSDPMYSQNTGFRNKWQHCTREKINCLAVVWDNFGARFSIFLQKTASKIAFFIGCLHWTTKKPSDFQLI